MLKVNDKLVPTIEDAARELGVSAKTVREWIEKGIIDPPPKEEFGLRTVSVFSPEYIDKAKKDLAKHRARK